MVNYPLNICKHNACKKYCNDNGYLFRIVTEKEIYNK